MRVNVLGGLSVTDGDTNCTPCAPKPRQLIALLALNANHVVSTGMLKDELWGERPPRSASTTLQTYVFQLRVGISHTPECEGDRMQARRRLATKPSGYQLNIREDESDVQAFKHLYHQGMADAAAGMHHAAVENLTEAVCLFSGPPLVDVHHGPVLLAMSRQLEESHLNAQEQRIASLLHTGRSQEAVTDLAALTTLHPLHEGLHSLLIQALHRSGRRNESLAVYQRIRQRLIDEIGIEPSVCLQRVQQDVLEDSQPVNG